MPASQLEGADGAARSEWDVAVKRVREELDVLGAELERTV